MTTCGLCLQPGPLVKSHIISKSLLFLDVPKDKPLIVVSNADKAPPVSRSHSGVWSRILCTKCEESFHADDEYLLRFVRDIAVAPVIKAKTKAGADGTDLSGFNLEILRRAFLGLLFRAHLSDHETFRKVDLGPKHYSSLRRFLSGQDANCPRAFAVYLRHLPMPVGRGIFDPFPEKWGDDKVHAYRFYIPHVTAMIKVDQRPMPDPWPPMALVTGHLKQALRATELSRSEYEVAGLLATDENVAKIDKIFAQGRAKSAPTSDA